MKVLLVNTNRYDQPLPVIPLGACMVAEALQEAGHQVQLLDFMFEADPVGKLKDKLTSDNFYVVALSIRNIDNNDMRSPLFFLEPVPKYVGAIREFSNATIVIGGAALGVMAEEILRFTGADYAVLGDGEYAMPELLARIAGGDGKTTPNTAHISNKIFMSNPRKAELSSQKCSVPDFSKWIDVGAYLSRMSTIPLQSKIGCHYKCVYCTYRKIEGEAYRLCSPACVLDAVRKLTSQGLRDIELVDNVFNSPYEHALEICNLLAQNKHGARLQSLELNPLFVDDSLIGSMEKAGFIGIGITAESASDNVLKKLRKSFSFQDINKAASVIRRHSLPCIWIFLLGGPGEKRDTVEKTFSFAENLVRPGDAVFFNIGIRIYPGTELEKIAREQGVLESASGDMLRPVFYLSPEIDQDWLFARASDFIKTHMNVIDSTSLGLPFLPALHKIGYRIGMKPPLWRHTRAIRRLLKYSGIYSYE